MSLFGELDDDIDVTDKFIIDELSGILFRRSFISSLKFSIKSSFAFIATFKFSFYSLDCSNVWYIDLINTFLSSFFSPFI
jgi:hypothetical protein